MGEEIKVNFPNGEMELGILKTIDDNGLLILSTSYGEKRISVGELFDV
jgi:biotin-(acetyl-CoA carboxylase) ligase